jgi:hypothetical protein
MDNKKIDDQEQQAPPQYEEVHAAQAAIDQVCEDATVKGLKLAEHGPIF